MTADQLRARLQELAGKIGELRDNLPEEMSSDEARTAHEEFDRVAAEYQETRQRLDRQETADRIQREEEERREAEVRRESLGGGRTAHVGAGPMDDPAERERTEWVVPDEATRARRNELRAARRRDERLTAQERVESYQHFADERAFLEYVCHGYHGMSTEAREHLRHGAPADRRALITGTATAANIATAAQGGELVPTILYNEIIEDMAHIGPMIEPGYCYPVEVPGVGPLEIATVDPTASKASIKAEGVAVGEARYAWGDIDLPSYTYTTELYPISWELAMSATAANVEDFVRRQLTMQFARGVNEHLTQGDGAGKPAGLVPGIPAANQITTAKNTEVTYNEIVDLVMKPNRAYRTMTSLQFSDATLGALMKLKDNQDRPLWQTNMREGVEEMIYGRRYRINPDIDDVAAANAGKIAMVFGGMQNYYVRRSGEMVYRRLEELGAPQRVTLHLAWTAFGGVVAQPDAFAGLKLKA